MNARGGIETAKDAEADRAPAVGARAEATAEDTRRNAVGTDVPAGRAVVSVAHDADEQAR
ncbi:MAG: hypothetical protein GAK33_07545 [Burkholderia lata]|uniref:Uncharacterized protein n=1 Tax=Burkholderia lata (strain ATCC 17760 / DSM 23089 / LMG 22485 / NCIMB 9086 / R18194 / 383) TaxID=482957 RepID=A0A833PGB0_BURL3|nr:MAG: hypothetical protein GAK33_07545 [Burkholderia lata]